MADLHQSAVIVYQCMDHASQGHLTGQLYTSQHQDTLLDASSSLALQFQAAASWLAQY